MHNVEPTEFTWRPAFVTNATPTFAFSVAILSTFVDCGHMTLTARIEYDLDYLRNWSPSADLTVVWNALREQMRRPRP